jgi:endonuclease/exonuclease/phosphatase family metal-dependent hydrolase
MEIVKRRLAPFLTCLGLALAAALGAGPLAMAQAAGAEEVRFRVMSFNIQHGRGADDVVDLGRTVRVILDEKADLIGLQEVDRGVRRTDRRDLPAELAHLSGKAIAFEKNHPHQGGEYGNAILTRFPMREVRNTHLPMVDATEQRGVIQAVVNVHGQEILFLNTHIAHRRVGEPERLASIAEFARILGENSAGPNLPVIFVGDFNAEPGSATHKLMAELMIDVWPLVGEGSGATIPVDKPLRRIDYVWVSRDAPFSPVRAWVPSTDASDHLPVMVEFVLPAASRK